MNSPVGRGKRVLLDSSKRIVCRERYKGGIGHRKKPAECGKFGVSDRDIPLKKIGST